MKLPFLRKMNPATMFYLNLCLVISLVIVAIYLGIYLRNNRLLMDSVKQQAASYLDLIVRVRRWNAGFGGIYVEKKNGVETNRYLREVGSEPDVVATDGRVFTLRNPALMTKEISKIFSEHSGIHFHITSRQLLNKENAPDLFEQRALKSFEVGNQEFWEIERGPAGPSFRYMAPLMVEQSCQKCHFRFNYKVGDVRGGISVSIPFNKIENELVVNRQVIIGLSILSLALLLGSSYLMLNQMSAKIEAANRAVREASITDELTGLRNRRFLMTRFNEEFDRARRNGGALGLLMLDLDHFKVINDTYGHPFGDLVLKRVAQTLAEVVRDYDIAGRYGGEEFAVVVPGSSSSDMLLLAERIRQRIEQTEIQDNTASARMTISAGVAALVDDDTVETLLKRADKALYQAKHEGRNRTVHL
jgi:diguanylate cyclase (GGDEF)-like protein